MTAYERLGGEPAVAALLEGLYRRAVADPLLNPFLENIDIPRLRERQFAFISEALGGPHRYSFPSLVRAHAGLRIEQRHFDAFVAHLHSSLQELGATEDLIAEISSLVTPLSGVIVNTLSGMTTAG
jgi:hemoglobin